MSDGTEYFRKTVVGLDVDLPSARSEIFQFWIHDYESKVAKLEPGKSFETPSVVFQPNLFSGRHRMIGAQEYGLRIQLEEGGAVVARLANENLPGLPDLADNENLRLFQIVDQDELPRFQSKKHPYVLDNEAILDPSNNILRDGYLVIDIVVSHALTQWTHPFVPRNPFCQRMLDLLSDEESADIAFKCRQRYCEEDEINNYRNVRALFGVGEENEDGPMESYAIVHGHLTILKACAPLLFSLCEGYGKDMPVPIDSVEPDIFRHLLRHIYGGKIPNSEIKRCPKAFIDAADRFGIIDLKMEAEAYLADVVDVENVVDMYQYAESMNCALLNEEVTVSIMKHGKDVLDESYQKIADTPGLALDLLELALDTNHKLHHEGEPKTFRQKADTFTVDGMRRGLHRAGLSVDGTRDILVSRVAKLLRKELGRKKD